MGIKKGFKFDDSPNTLKQAKAEYIARELVTYLNKFHSLPNVRDKDTDLFLYQSYADVLRREKKAGYKELDFPYFSPSSAGSDARELYVKAMGAERDEQEVKPFQTRWQNIGTAIGDMIQHDILVAERNFDKLTGEPFPFKFETTPLYHEPMFEEFAFKRHFVEAINPFYLVGTTDGILHFTDVDGRVYRVGLEVKSKQTTYAGTGFRNLKEANPKHKKQTVCYSLMYGVDFWIILYVNGSKKAWSMTEEEFAKSPDIRAFGHYVTEEMKEEQVCAFNDILEAKKTGKPPKLDLTKWTFNNFKKACALDLSEEEFLELIDEAIKITESEAYPQYIKNEVTSAIRYIASLRGGAAL